MMIINALKLFYTCNVFLMSKINFLLSLHMAANDADIAFKIEIMIIFSCIYATNLCYHIYGVLLVIVNLVARCYSLRLKPSKRSTISEQ